MAASERPPISSHLQRVLAFASDSADGLGHGSITCQHLLYGLACEGRSVASAVLVISGIQANSILSFLEARSAIHDRTALLQIDLATEVQIILKKAVDLATGWGSDEVDTEHILSAMLHEASSADEILDSLGITKAQILDHFYLFQQNPVGAAPSQNSQYLYRLSYDSAQILAVACEFARRERAEEVNPFHLILALASCPGKVKSLLESEFLIDSQIWLRRIEDSQHVVLNHHEPSPGKSVQEILGYALGQAWNRGHLTVTPLHIALGIVYADQSEALDLLAESGVSRAELFEVLDAALPPVSHP